MMKLKTKQRKCSHYWIIAPPDGPTSYGRCKLCGSVTEFYNDISAKFSTIKGLPNNSLMQQVR